MYFERVDEIFQVEIIFLDILSIQGLMSNGGQSHDINNTEKSYYQYSTHNSKM